MDNKSIDNIKYRRKTNLTMKNYMYNQVCKYIYKSKNNSSIGVEIYENGKHI